MKKIIALILALALALGVVGAFAADPSATTGGKENAGTPVTEDTNNEAADEGGEEETDAIISVFLEDTEETAKVMADLGEAEVSREVIEEVFGDAAADIPEEFNTINEIKTYLLDNVPEDYSGSITVPYKFQTPYKAGKIVKVAYGIPQADGTIKWIVLEGVVSDGEGAFDEGDVIVTFPEEVWKEIEGKKVTMVVLSEGDE